MTYRQSCGLLAEDWPQSFEQYTQNGQYFRQNVMIWLFKKYFGLFRLHSYLSAAPSVKQGHVFFIYSRPYLRLGAHNSDLWPQNVFEKTGKQRAYMQPTFKNFQLNGFSGETLKLCLDFL